jgi:hypothetical protein
LWKRPVIPQRFIPCGAMGLRNERLRNALHTQEHR